MDSTSAYAALYARIKSKLTGVEYFTRRPLTWEQVPAFPAVEVCATHLEGEQKQGRGPTIWRLYAAVVIYSQAVIENDPDTSPDDALLGIIAQVENALKAQPGEAGLFTTLGGACDGCGIAGDIQFIGGNTQAQAMAVIPVEILIH